MKNVTCDIDLLVGFCLFVKKKGLLLYRFFFFFWRVHNRYLDNRFLGFF